MYVIFIDIYMGGESVYEKCDTEQEAIDRVDELTVKNEDLFTTFTWRKEDNE